jgi:hypothetical protein
MEYCHNLPARALDAHKIAQGVILFSALGRTPRRLEPLGVWVKIIEIRTFPNHNID